MFLLWLHKTRFKAVFYTTNAGIATLSNVINMTTFLAKPGDFPTPRVRLFPGRKRSASNLVMFPCVTGDFSGILERNVKACILCQLFCCCQQVPLPPSGERRSQH